MIHTSSSVEILPTLPDASDLLPTQAVDIERHVAKSIMAVQDIDTAQEWLAQADALTAYLRHKEAQGPMLGAMRRIEARIGELLGEAQRGRPSADNPLHGTVSSEQLRKDFRKLASKVRRGILDYNDDSDDSPWRASRRALLLGQGGHTSENSGNDEWNTPSEFIESARRVMGSIDFDPCSTAIANEVVKATTFFTKENDALHQDWPTGTAWMNPPFSHPLIWLFCERLLDEVMVENITQACVFVNNATDTAWFQRLVELKSAFCFPSGRVKCWNPSMEGSTPLQGRAILYFGDNADEFVAEFIQYGWTE